MIITDTTSTLKKGDIVHFTDVGEYNESACRVIRIGESADDKMIILLEVIEPVTGQDPFVVVTIEDDDTLERVVLQ